MKYSETKSEWIYDWPTIIDDLEADRYTDAGKNECVVAAAMWPTCACGNQCDAIERLWTGEPRDYVLTERGVQFADDILALAYNVAAPRANNASAARRTLAIIERRSAELLSAQP